MLPWSTHLSSGEVSAAGLSPLSLSIRRIHIGICIALTCLLTWALLTTDPFAVVKNTSLAAIRAIHDAAMHLGAYAVFATACFALHRRRSDTRRQAIIFALLTAHALITEMIQTYIPRRTPDPIDALANIVGIAIGLVVATRLTGYRAQVSATERRRA